MRLGVVELARASNSARLRPIGNAPSLGATPCGGCEAPIEADLDASAAMRMSAAMATSGSAAERGPFNAA